MPVAHLRNIKPRFKGSAEAASVMRLRGDGLRLKNYRDKAVVMSACRVSFFAKISETITNVYHFTGPDDVWLGLFELANWSSICISSGSSIRLKPQLRTYYTSSGSRRPIVTLCNLSRGTQNVKNI